jgi:D-glycero-D-manno-heptose 1,7-bisphosphate phosphatase
MNKAAFLECDGVVNWTGPEGQYLTLWEAMHFLTGVASAIALLNKAWFRVIVVSNQCYIARGLVTAADVDAILRRKCKELADAGAIIDAVHYCPHEKTPPCSFRKQAPGKLLCEA